MPMTALFIVRLRYPSRQQYDPQTKSPAGAGLLSSLPAPGSEQSLGGCHRRVHVWQLSDLRDDLHIAHDAILVGDDYGTRQQMERRDQQAGVLAKFPGLVVRQEDHVFSLGSPLPARFGNRK